MRAQLLVEQEEDEDEEAEQAAPPKKRRSTYLDKDERALMGALSQRPLSLDPETDAETDEKSDTEKSVVEFEDDEDMEDVFTAGASNGVCD